MTSEAVLTQLIAIQSVSGHEAAIQQWIHTYLQHFGLHPEIVQGNVVCHIPGQDSSKSLIFNGHVDTVSAGDAAAWQTPPLQATTANGKLYGLGASDMKAGLAVMLILAEKYSKDHPPVDLWFHFVVQEETNAQGTHDVMAWFAKKHLKHYKQTAGILLESTGLKNIEIAHKGNIFLKLTTKGDSGHGSVPELVRTHAVGEMIAAIEHLEYLIGSWSPAYDDPMLGKPTVALTSIQAGSQNSPNKVADTCVATFDLRTTPKLHDKAFGIIQKYFGDEVLVETVYDPLPCGYTSGSEHIVQIAQQATGLPTATTPGSTDMLFFTALNIPAIILGPGEKSMEHKANEFVELATMKKAVKVMTEIIEAF